MYEIIAFQILESVLDVFNNVLDDSNMEGWRALQSVSVCRYSLYKTA